MSESDEEVHCFSLVLDPYYYFPDGLKHPFTEPALEHLNEKGIYVAASLCLTLLERVPLHEEIAKDLLEPPQNPQRNIDLLDNCIIFCP